MESVAWPPQYKVKKNYFSKSVRLRFNKDNLLELTVPRRFRLKHIPEILEEHKDWIIEHLKATPKKFILPENFSFHCLHQNYKVHYVTASTKLRLSELYQGVILTGDVQDYPKIKLLLAKWIKQFSEFHLQRLLNEVSANVQLPYQKMSLRDQKTRWGSCTSDKVITLNYKLIFLPLELVQYILIHELCHTMHMNHSQRFWRLVAKHDPLFNEHRKALREANQFIPEWL